MNFLRVPPCLTQSRIPVLMERDSVVRAMLRLVSDTAAPPGASVRLAPRVTFSKSNQPIIGASLSLISQRWRLATAFRLMPPLIGAVSIASG